MAAAAKRWVLLEQKHEEKVRQRKTEEVAREQQQRLGQPEKTRGEHRGSQSGQRRAQRGWSS